jgi:transcriptional regulator with XRE-family HTH domain
VKPFNFLLAYQAQPLFDASSLDGETVPYVPTSRRKKGRNPVRPVAPFDRDHSRAIRNCFDRETGGVVRLEQLKTYREALAQYHLHPETKFLDAEHLDRGPTRRRHIKVAAINLIGKEADRLEEQIYLGLDPEAEINYGHEPPDSKLFLAQMSRAVKTHGIGKVAKAAGISRQQLWEIIRRNANPSDRTLESVGRAIAALDLPGAMPGMDTHALLDQARWRCRQIGLRSFAELVKIDAGNLSRILSGKRKMSKPTARTIGQVLGVTPFTYAGTCQLRGIQAV